MELIIDKFIEYLEETQNKIIQNYYNISIQLSTSKEEQEESKYQKELSKNKKEIIIINKLLQFLKASIKDCYNYKELFNDFKELSVYLLESPLNDREKTQVIFHIITKNISTGIFDDNCRLVSYRKVKKMKIDDATKDKYLEEISLDKNEFIALHKSIFDHYFTKKETFNETDITEIIKTLTKLSVDEKILESITRTLNKKLMKTKAKTSIVRQKPLFKDINLSEKSSKDENKLSNKEYKIIIRKLNNYINLETMKPIRPLIEEELIYCISLLLKISLSKEQIIIFCKSTEKENQQKMNPIVLYRNIYNRLKYYLENQPLNIDTQLLTEYFAEIFITKDDDYIFWKTQIQEELSNIINQLPKEYEYEINQAKKLLKQKVN